MKSAIRPWGSVPESPAPGFWTKMSLIVPGGSDGTPIVSVFSSTNCTLVAATPPTVTVAPSSKTSPLTVAAPPKAGPEGGVDEITKRGVNSDVLPPGSVAVDEMGEPFGTAIGSTALMVALPDPSVLTWVDPR